MKKLSKITESIWSDMQDRSAGDAVREEDKIITNEELKNRIQKLYKEQGEGETLDVSSLTNFICDDFSNIFSGLREVKRIIGLENWDVSNVENMEGMFAECEKFNADLSNWNVSGVGNMRCMFYNCQTFNSDLSNWNVSSVKDMGFMFWGCENFNSDLSNWNVSSVEDVSIMFYDCKSLKQIPSWYINR